MDLTESNESVGMSASQKFLVNKSFFKWIIGLFIISLVTFIVMSLLLHYMEDNPDNEEKRKVFQWIRLISAITTIIFIVLVGISATLSTKQKNPEQKQGVL